MTHEELLTRVYAARRQLMMVGGTDTQQWSVALHPFDLHSIREDAKLAFGEDFHAQKVWGLPINPDARLRIGEVRLRAEVAA